MSTFLRRYQVALFTAMAVLFMITGTGYIVAKRDPAKGISDEQVASKKYQQAILKFEKHLVIENGQIALKIKDAKQLGVDQAIYNELVAALDGTNQRIKNGEIKLEEVTLNTDFSEKSSHGHNNNPPQPEEEKQTPPRH